MYMVTLLGEKELAILFFRCENIWCASYCYFMSAYCMCGILKLNCIFNSKTFYLFSFSERWAVCLISLRPGVLFMGYRQTVKPQM